MCLLWLGCSYSLPEDVERASEDLPEEVSYNFHIKPILSDRCYACHGPDEEAREADLRLDLEEHAKKLLESGSKAVVPKSPKRSELASRILSEVHDYQMPPPDSKLKLLPEEKAMLIRWIEQGASFEKHWSFIPPVKTQLPEVAEEYRVNNAIDNFVIFKVLEKGLKPSQIEDRERLIRRVSLDLTGLPPTLEEIDAFLADESEDAFEKVVDRLLKSEACAERLAMEWLDVSRYADSHGLHADGSRTMWPWRDWVISSFHQNMPYDEFVTQQIAGDLLPDAERDKIMATAFHRNHPMTAEGGAIDEEFRLEYVADRTNTTATAFMGLTVECAKCHDHKFDPISQKEYYQLSAFFNNQRELGMTGDDGNFGPILTLESEATSKMIKDLEMQLQDVNMEIKGRERELQEISDYIKDLPPVKDKAPSIYLPMEQMEEISLKGKKFQEIDGKLHATSDGDPKLVPGKIGHALEFDHEYDDVELEGIGQVDIQEAFSAALWVHMNKMIPGKTQVLVGNAGNKNNYWRGWDFYFDVKNRINLRMINCLPHNLIHVRSKDTIPVQTWTHLAFTYNGSGEASGAKIFINGRQVQVDIEYNRLTKNIRTIQGGAHEEYKRPLRIAKSYRAFTGDNGVYEGLIDEFRFFENELSPFEIAGFAEIPINGLSEEDRWNHFFLSDNVIRQLKKKRSGILAEVVSIRDTVPEIMVMEEMQNPRSTFVLNRGQYDSPADRVQPGTPRELLPFPDDMPKNRLGLAKWLFHPDHPLTARAAVNRYWQMIFGTGIVKTANDFGSQGALPTHPELLDWLAVSFQEKDWNVKDLLKLMVMSATYQQSSRPSPEQKEVDPDNIYLSSSPTYRWPAEIIRDNALAASGLLVRKVGGPSVKPYQPPGLWIEKGNFSHDLLRYVQDTGEDLYRRSMYTFIKRTSPHPAMTVFDAPTRDICTLTRESTNTPLQALVLLNDPQFVEAARVMAARIQKHFGPGIDEMAYGAFRLATGRIPTAEEMTVLKKIYHEQINIFEDDSKATSDLLKVGEYPMDQSLPKASTAAWTMVCSSLLNHDEAYMKR